MPAAPTAPRPLDDAEIEDHLRSCAAIATALRGRLGDSVKQLQDLGKAVNGTDAATSRMCFHIATADAEIKATDAERQRLQGLLVAAGRTAAQRNQAARATAANLQHAATERAVLDTTAELQRVRAVHAADAERLTDALRQTASLQEESTALKADLQQAQGTITELRGQVKDLQEHLATATQQLQQAEGDTTLEKEIDALQRNNARNVELVRLLTEQLENQKKVNTQLIKDFQDLEEASHAAKPTDGNGKQVETLQARVAALEAQLTAASASTAAPKQSVECQIDAPKPPPEVPKIAVPVAAGSSSSPKPAAGRSPTPEASKQHPVLGLEVGFHGEEGKSLSVLVVKPDGPAQEAGVQVGDLLGKWDGTPIPTEKKAFETLLRRHRVGDTVQLDILRRGEPVTLALKIGGADTKPGSARTETPRSGGTSPRVGVAVPPKPKPKSR